MAKKIIIILIILIIIAFFSITQLESNTIDVYIDGENVSVETHTFSSIDVKNLNIDICDLTMEVMNNPTSNITTLKEDIEKICEYYGLNNTKINIDSIIGENQIPVIVHVDGTSMLPTLQDGQSVLINKTHNIKVGDIVVADSKHYGGIIKRIGNINGDDVYLQSDNKNVSYEYINGALYEIKGVSTWVSIDDINGVVISY